MTQKEQFIDFLKYSTKLADRTQKHYSWALSNIDNTIARIKNVDTFDIYQVQDIRELDEIIGALKQDDELKNNRERGKYIAALKKYRELISGSNPVMSNNKEQNKGVDSRQIIFFGTPGSGKSYRVKVLTEEKRVHRTTFHPDSDYASFVGCYKPTMKDGEISYSFTPQIFTEAYVDAWKNPKEEVYLVIEEINRGNCAQIFGDLFQLLDRKNKTGYSVYPITADSDLRDYLYGVLGEGHEGIKDGKLCLPPNLRIFATMNTSDQSLFPMDSAFKRRWDWEYVPVDYREPESNFTITLGEEKYRWLEFLQTINQRIFKATNSEDKQMGNFFIKEHVSESEFKSKIMFYLWNEVCRDEYGTQNNFFRFIQNDKDIEFSFNDLYQTDGWKKLQGFMEYLGVLPLSLTEGTEEE
jgi:type II restriction-modification system restriction subunit